MEFKGTKGEWKVKEYKEDCWISIDSESGHNRSLATVSPSKEVYNTALYNAKLIAAAPDLLKALLSIVKDSSNIIKYYNHARQDLNDEIEWKLEEAQQAINKALN